MVRTEGLTGRVILQGEGGYDEARFNYNGRFNKFPKVIVYCEVVQDVVNAILWARKQQIPFRVRGGGHSYEAFSNVDGGLVIDVSGLLRLEINRDVGTAQVGAGFRLMDLYEALWKQRVTIPGGTCRSVGISGLTLGGGYGLLSRLMGMTCDNVLGLEIVTAKGKIIYANEGQHSNLFWACRGGGDGSFGVITSFTFRVHPIKNVARYRMTWDFSDLEKVVRYWQAWAPHVDARLTSLLSLTAKGRLRSNGVFVGSEQELKQIMRPLQEATRPKTCEFHSTTWIEVARRFAALPVKQEKFKNSSAYAYEPLSDEALGVLIRNLQAAPGPTNVVAFDAYGGSISEVPTDETPFVHRKALFVIQYLSYWSEDAEADKNIRWIEKFRESMLLYTHGAYRDYCDSNIPDWPIAYFGENFARLKKVKRMYDPENLFRFEQSIPK
ncbi:dehydrogenase [Bacillus sp. AFS059628]|uniref:FAD-binding oxidoreductase n=1 Tax=Bacillus sp. AFS059628 TaxID=2033508 RepID=UPI000BF68353|nr:FAD-binding oxidoreductase [Bacillus sp. AFS059628]PFV80066.1 dehydrogenase [Bacillus sp. AFS059628]